MGSTHAQRASGGHAIARLAERSHGVVTRDQLRGVGLTDHVIEGLCRRGHLHRLHRCVYAVGHARLTPHGRWIAAVWAGGDRAVLSHRSAAALWGLLPDAGRPPEITAPTHRRSRRGLRVHLSALPTRSCTIREGIRCATVARTLVDLAGTEHRAAAERAWSAAASRRLVRATDVAFELGQRPGAAGVALVRGMLDAHDGYLVQRTRSELERLALPLMRQHGVPRPACNQLLEIDGERFEVDLLWAAPRVAVELDGRVAHAHVDAFDRDRERDTTLQLAGWRVMRITWGDLTREPDRTMRRLRAMLTRAPSAG